MAYFHFFFLQDSMQSWHVFYTHPCHIFPVDCKWNLSCSCNQGSSIPWSYCKWACQQQDCCKVGRPIKHLQLDQREGSLCSYWSSAPGGSVFASIFLSVKYKFSLGSHFYLGKRHMNLCDFSFFWLVWLKAIASQLFPNSIMEFSDSQTISRISYFSDLLRITR